MKDRGAPVTQICCASAIEKKLTTNFGNIVEIVFNGNCVCYATNNCYFVQNINEKNGIKLFDVADCEVPKVICSVGMEEFCVAGIQSLLMFVNGEGASTRPPLSLPGQEPPIGLCLKEPYLNVLDTAGILFIFSIHDGSLKQSLEFPSDDETNIDGQTFIIPPFSGCFFELIAMTIYSQIEENILHGYLDIAWTMLEEQISVNFENLNELT
uniref:Uncharacterized protein n=1 Tax=Meloidogyne javanica TaxID=6303 RepID=A0A915LHJ3_MELJA